MDIKWKVTGDLLTAGKNVALYWTLNQSSYTALGVTNYDADAATGGCSLVAGPNQPYSGCARIATPDALSATFQVRVSDPDDTEIKLLSGNKTVVGKVEIQYPVGAETVITNGILDISWISFGTLDDANDTVIDFDTDYASGAFTTPGLAPSSPYTNLTQTSGAGSNNGTACSPPATVAPQRGGCYRVTVPDLFSNLNARIRVTDGTTNAKNAASTDFTIKGQIDVVSRLRGRYGRSRLRRI